MNYARKRDANEAVIVASLRAFGAQVVRLNEPGVPDLLVKYHGALFLLEVKDAAPGRVAHRRNQGDHAALTPAQVAWWAAWGEPAPSIVMTPYEALQAIGAVHGGPVGSTTTPPQEGLQGARADSVRDAVGRAKLGQGRKVRSRRG